MAQKELEPVDVNVKLLNIYAKTGSATLTAQLLKVTPMTVYRAVTTPQFQAALRKHVSLELAADASIARRLLRRIVLDKAATNKEKIDAAKTLLALGGFVAPKAQDPNRAPESPAEMTSDQLRDYLSKIEGELAARSTPVDAQPEPSPLTQAIDLL